MCCISTHSIRVVHICSRLEFSPLSMSLYDQLQVSENAFPLCKITFLWCVCVKCDMAISQEQFSSLQILTSQLKPWARTSSLLAPSLWTTSRLTLHVLPSFCLRVKMLLLCDGHTLPLTPALHTSLTCSHSPSLIPALTCPHVPPALTPALRTSLYSSVPHDLSQNRLCCSY